MRRRRGLSTVVTAAIMLTFVAVLGTTLVTWSHSHLASFETALVNSTSTLTNQINENVVIENIQYFNQVCTCESAHHGINVTITNTGNEGLKVNHVFLNNTDVSNNAFSDVSGSSSQISTEPLQLLPKKSGTIIININQVAIDPGSPNNVKISTSRGTVVTGQVMTN